jgi:hypothetical protein
MRSASRSSSLIVDGLKLGKWVLDGFWLAVEREKEGGCKNGKNFQ